MARGPVRSDQRSGIQAETFRLELAVDSDLQFEGGHDGTHPYGLLLIPGGTLYGTAGSGLPGSGREPGTRSS